MSNAELQQRIEATNRLNEMAMSTMEKHTPPVELLAEALKLVFIFLPAEVVSDVEVILDATGMEVQE